MVVKLIPVMGTLVLIGAVVQVFLGFLVAGGAESLTGPHILLGILGLALVVGLAVVAFRAKTTTVASKAVMTILTVIVFLQVLLGFQVLGGAESMVTSHMAAGFLVVILSLLAGGITMMSAKKARRA